MFVVRCDLCGTITHEPEPGDEETPGWLRLEFTLALQPDISAPKAVSRCHQLVAHACPNCVPHVQKLFPALQWEAPADV